MKFPIGAMTVGDILDRGLKILLSRLPTFYLINFIVLTPIILIQLAGPLIGEALLLGQHPLLDVNLSRLLGLYAGAILALFAQLVLHPIATAASLHVISQEFVGRRVGLGEAFRFSLRYFVPLFGASLLSSLAIGFGLITCVVPGIFFAIWFVFAAQVVVVEHRPAIDSLTRSKNLGEGYQGRIFGVGALLILVSMVIMIFAGILQQILPPVDTKLTPPAQPGGSPELSIVFNYTNFVIDTLISFPFGILAQTYQAVCLTLLYFDLRIRKEGYDLELAAQQEGTPVP
jgi:hypothetical protein